MNEADGSQREYNTREEVTRSATNIAICFGDFHSASLNEIQYAYCQVADSRHMFSSLAQIVYVGWRQ